MMRPLLKFGLTAIVFLFTTALLAQTGTIRGFLYDKENGEPMIFTGVAVKGTALSASTDVNGYFSITRVPAGKQTLVVVFGGYETLESAVTVTSGGILTEKLY
ncbi:MAG TPA: carboxypeptidase-like regulatory domain-containing protein, partial [Flavobacteriales bacterium]|nr:carboxypeptidase-like regulatory domain-containing protein [Flavobacteriales bacterium]